MRTPLAACVLLLLTTTIQAQDVLHTGASELGVYAGGAVSIPGGAPGSHDYFMAAGRWSRVMANFGGGAFEYGVEVYPAVIVHQSLGPNSNVYAIGGSPLQLR